ncbi:unnamed protein product (macronuclear) [Paramecium tetraurelia]|uniref:Enkurin domain-containing protein n=1 Tax=Paramecium tetraurelia TaxID=5888 RepID=A0DVY9_PARTE|nr:uncharacterized protein GSPATT00020859001 [Paramecium tetraurelia]CAK87206.1 unnamed protein product [Paramecium tetraurelia]|eukprot:XP_001454603.1 hypothetical protein (macronuclear) [Paramecium tetraurelia strain d4-2]
MAIYFPEESDRINKKAEQTKQKILEMRKIAQEQFGVVFPDSNPFQIKIYDQRESIKELDENIRMYKKIQKNDDRVFIDFEKKNQYMLDHNSFKTLQLIKSQKQVSEDKIETSCQSYQSLINRSLKSVLSQRFDKATNVSKKTSPRTYFQKDRSCTVRTRTITLTKRKTMNPQKVEFEGLISEQRKILQTSHLKRYHKDKLQQDFSNLLAELNNIKIHKEETIFEKYKKKYLF